MRTGTRELALVIALLTFLGSHAGSAAEPLQINWSDLRGVGDVPVSPRDAQFRVVCFLGSECPLAKLYGPRLNTLTEAFASQGVAFVGVNSNPQDSPADVGRYIQAHGLQFPVVKDADQSLANQFGATRTPEVFVLDASGRVQYHGRIDDQYEAGTSRPQPTQHDLRDALAALIAGRPISQVKTAAVGCLITRIARPSATDPAAPAVTFTRDVAPLLNRHCVECHREGEIGPFALTDYDEVVGWSQMILEVIDQKRMPPWHADPRHGKFLGQRTLPAEARATLAAWVAQGMPQGDSDDLPPQPQWISGWHLLSPPAAEFAMRDRPFVVPAEGTVEYQYFVVDPQWDKDRWIRAAQVIPGAAAVVHHAIVFVRPPDGSHFDGIGWLGAYVPGQRTIELPPGHARLIPAGSKLVFQMHYTPNGRETTDITRVGVWFSNDKEVTHEVSTRVALNHDFEIPPHAADHQVEMQLNGFPHNSRLLGATPHMHLRGKSFQLVARRGEQRETQLSFPHYHFNWQHWYQFESPVDLEAVDSLEMSIRFDNSSANPTNPAPREYVTWGDQTWQEMAVAFFDVAVPRGGSQRAVHRTNAGNSLSEAVRAERIQQQTAAFLKEMDRDGDGVILRAEAPVAFRLFGFRQLDRDRDDRLDRLEIENAAAQRL